MTTLLLARLVEKRSARVALASAFILVGAAAVLTRADAAERAFAVGEVTTRVVRADVDLESALRASLERAIRDLDVSRPGGKVVLSASLVGMDVDTATRSVTCSVSVAMRTAKGGVMIGILEGRARVGLESARSASVERRAIDAAVRAAVARLPDALR